MHARGCRTGAELGSLRVAWYTHGPPPDMPRAPYEVRGGRVGWITCNPGHQSRPAPSTPPPQCSSRANYVGIRTRKCQRVVLPWEPMSSRGG